MVKLWWAFEAHVEESKTQKRLRKTELTKVKIDKLFSVPLRDKYLDLHPHIYLSELINFQRAKNKITDFY